MSIIKNACVYAHYAPYSNIPFYIGMTTWEHFRPYCFTNRTSEWNKIAKNGVEVKIIKRGLTQVEARILEATLIVKYHGNLVNGGKYKNTQHRPCIVKRKIKNLKNYGNSNRINR